MMSELNLDFFVGVVHLRFEAELFFAMDVGRGFCRYM